MVTSLIKIPQTTVFSKIHEIDELDNRQDINKTKKFKSVLLATVFCIVLSSLQFGYTVGVVNAPEKLIRQWYNETYILRHHQNQHLNLNTILWAVTVACYGMSGLMGALISGYLCDRFGRKKTLLFNNIPSILAAIFVLLAKPFKTYELMILARLFIGLSCGVTSVIVPIYLAEISPINLRGKIGSTNQLSLTISTLASQLLGLPFLLGTENLWPVLFAICAIPGLIQLGTLSFMPESPRYNLVNRKDESSAHTALLRLRQIHPTIVKAEIEKMKQEYREEQLLPKVTWKDMVSKPVYRKPMFITCMAQLGQQLTGIGAILSFSTSIFASAGLSGLISIYATCGISLVNVLFTLVSMSLIERLGRRTLFLFGLAGMGIFSALLTIFLVFTSIQTTSSTNQSFASVPSSANREWMLYAVIGTIIGFVCSYAIGPGVIAWFISAEVFTQAARSKGTSIAMVVNWLTNFLTVLGFPLLYNVMGNFVFLIFTVMAVISWLYLFYNLPETKGRDPEEIAKTFFTSLSQQGKGPHYSKISNKH